MDKIVALNIAAYLACTYFVFGLVNSGMKLWQRFKGEAPHPANPQLGQSIAELDRRVAEMEQWRSDLTEKLEADKIQVLNAGEERAAKIHEHIEEDSRETARKLDSLSTRVMQQAQDTERALGRIEGKLDSIA